MRTERIHARLTRLVEKRGIDGYRRLILGQVVGAWALAAGGAVFALVTLIDQIAYDAADRVTEWPLLGVGLALVGAGLSMVDAARLRLALGLALVGASGPDETA